MPLYSKIYSVPYIMIFSVLFLLSFKFGSRNNNVNLQVQFFQERIAFFVLFVFLGLRGFIQSDWRSYYDAFLKAPTFFDSNERMNYFVNQGAYSDWEKGFLLLYILCKSIVSEWWFFQAFSFVFDFVIAFHFIRTFVPKHKVMGICFYFVFGALLYDVNLMRNSKSIMLFCLSLKFITTKKIVPYLLLNLLGMLFHASAVIFIPLYFILGRKPSKKLMLLIFILGNAIYILQIHWVQSVLELVAGIIGGRLEVITVGYLSSVKWTTGYGISIGYLERIMTFFLAIHFMDRLLQKQKDNNVILNLVFIYIFSTLFFSEMSILTDRIGPLFLFSYWVFYPQIYEFLSREKKTVFLVIFFAYSVMKILSGYAMLPCLYDNLLLQKYSVPERKIWLNRFYNFLMKGQGQ